MTTHGGLITLDDLAQYRAIERRPLTGQLSRTTLSSPRRRRSRAASRLIETLQILENYRPKPGASYATDADYFHYVIEAWKVRDPVGRIADPALLEVDLGPHLDPGHAAESVQEASIPAKASRYGGADPPRH